MNPRAQTRRANPNGRRLYLYNFQTPCLMPCIICIDKVCTDLYNTFVKYKQSLKPFQGYKGYRIEFSEEKNLLLQETRGLCFEDVLQAIEEKKILDDLRHSSQKYPHQRILVIEREKYVYAVPYVLDPKRKTVFLKTVYPSRVLTEKYMKGGIKK